MPKKSEYTRKKTVLPAIAATVGAAVLTVSVFLFAFIFVVARGPARSAAGRLCATMTEKGFALTDIFFTTSEIEKTTSYLPPRPFDGECAGAEEKDVPEGGISLSGKYWNGFLWQVPDGYALSLVKGGKTQPETCLGLSGSQDAVFIGDCLTYVGDGPQDRFCFAGIGSDGRMNAGLMTAAEAANAGFVWGISADRLLVSGGKPCADLGGGYASRAALGMRADGSFIVFAAVSSSVYPCGITYGELAAVMYGYGAVTAVALRPAGEFLADGEKVAEFGGSTGYRLIPVRGTEDAG